MNHPIPKIAFSEAVKMLDAGYYLMHLNYLLGGERSEIYRQNRDCSHFLVQAGRDWRNPNNKIVLVIADAEAEKKYLGSRAGTEKYGEQDRTYEELIIENQLLKKAIRVYLHDSASPLSYFRNQIPNIEFWLEQLDEGQDNTKYFEKVTRIGKGIIRSLNVLIKFRRTLWRAVDRGEPPTNEELRTVIADIGNVLRETEQNAQENNT